MQDFKRLEVWQLAHQLTLSIYAATTKFPPDERFGLTSHLRRAASSVGANLAEGCGRGTDIDFARFVPMATGSATEVECHLLSAKDLGYLEINVMRQIDDSLQRVRSMMIALLKRLRSN